MGHKSSKEPDDEETVRKKSSRDMRLSVPDEANNIHTVVAPKALLMEHSGVFRQLVESGTLNKRKNLKLQDVTVTGILKILEYVENGSVSFQNVKEVSQTLKAALKYKVEGIENVCLEYLNTILNASCVCDVYEFSIDSEFPELKYKCLKIIDEEAASVLASQSFLNLKQISVVDIIRRNTLNIDSEKIVFDAVLSWGKAELGRQGQDDSSTSNLKRVCRPLLPYVRFLNMFPEEFSGPLISELNPSSPTTEDKDVKYGMMSRLSQSTGQHDSNPENRSSLSLSSQPRSYISHYVHNMEVIDSTQHAVNNGESFCLTIEMLKGEIFLCGVNLALKKFSARMIATCLYGLLTATNTRTGEQKRVRDTFMDTTEDCSLVFSSPLVVKGNDTAEIVLNVKMAGNTAPLSRKNDVEIIVPSNNKDIAFKVLPSNSTTTYARCIFKNILYYF